MTALRPLNLPVPIGVETGPDGEPLAIAWRGRRLAVAAVADSWRIDDEWWRRPISRLYRCLVLEDERMLVVFEDLLAGRWFAQRYDYSARYVHRPVRVVREPRRRVSYRLRRGSHGRAGVRSWAVGGGRR